MIRNIIFDMDGVLIDSENAIRTACIMMFNELNVHPKHEDFMEFVGMGENRFIGGVGEKYGLAFSLDMKKRAYDIYEEIAEEYVDTYEGIQSLIIELKNRGYTLAVASAADEIKVKINLGCIGLKFEDFGAIVTGSDVDKKKPDPELFVTAASKIGANPGETLVVEDAVTGCQAARAAGMRCVGVSTTFSGQKLLDAGAEIVIAKTKDLLNVLDNFKE